VSWGDVSDLRRDPDPPPGSALLDRGAAEMEKVGEVDVRPFQLHFARLHLRRVQHVVDQGEQVLGRGDDFLQRVALRVREIVFGILQDQLRESDHVVQWGAQLVAHVREELRFLPVRFLGPVPCALQLRVLLAQALAALVYESRGGG
jgi:hypothetical protein